MELVTRGADAADAGEGDKDLQPRLTLLAASIDLLLRQAERQLESDVQAAFAAGQASTVMQREMERGKTRTLRDDLRHLRAADAAVGERAKRRA